MSKGKVSYGRPVSRWRKIRERDGCSKREAKNRAHVERAQERARRRASRRPVWVEVERTVVPVEMEPVVKKRLRLRRGR